MRALSWIFNIWVAYGAMSIVVNAALAETRLLALGDSLTAGYGLPAEASFPAQLEKALRGQGYDVRVINAGVSGDTSAGGLARLDWALAEDPQFAIVALGANDGLRGLAPAEMEKNLDSILARLKARKIQVLLAGMLAPPNYGRAYAQDYAAVFPRVAKKHDVALYPFFLDGVASQAKLNQPDGMHPTEAGIAVMVDKIMPAVKALLGKVGRVG